MLVDLKNFHLNTPLDRYKYYVAQHRCHPTQNHRTKKLAPPCSQWLHLN
jgi:hypothetical protein